MKWARWAVVVVAVLSFTGCQVLTEEFPTGPGPTPTPTPDPDPTKTKTPKPRARATPTDDPDPTPTRSGDCDPTEWLNNCNPVAKVGLVTFYVACPSIVVIPNSKYKIRAEVGCMVRLDATPKDEWNVQTKRKGTPKYTLGRQMYPVSWPNGIPYTAAVTGNKKRKFTAYVMLDGIK